MRVLEINTRVWIKRFADNIKLGEVPSSYFQKLVTLGFDAVWLMGVWKTCPNIIKKCCFTSELVSSYSKSLTDWTEADVIGSPFAIDDYLINPSLGTEEDLTELKTKLNRFGLKLFLDFIPNHFSAGTHLLDDYPEIFLYTEDDSADKDPFAFFYHKNMNDKSFAHGRDPLFPPWTDTVQVNFFSEKARRFLIDKIIDLTRLCDGLRCDMAMLPLNNVFNNTWMGIISKQKLSKPRSEFWHEAISEVRKLKHDFIFIAEAYWDLEWQLQQLGFDFTYDKRLTDKLAGTDVFDIKLHLMADINFQKKSVRFLENHDEPRAIEKYGPEKSLAAATIINTIPGMKLIYDGQMEGKKIKLPVQLGREPDEKSSSKVYNFYLRLFEITKTEIFTKGEWELREPVSAGGGNQSFHNFLAWSWRLADQLILVIVNYSDLLSQCRIRLNLETKKNKLALIDLLTNQVYLRLRSEIANPGLYVELKGFQAHIFYLSDK